MLRVRLTFRHCFFPQEMLQAELDEENREQLSTVSFTSSSSSSFFFFFFFLLRTLLLRTLLLLLHTWVPLRRKFVRRMSRNGNSLAVTPLQAETSERALIAIAILCSSSSSSSSSSSVHLVLAPFLWNFLDGDCAHGIRHFDLVPVPE